LVALGVAVAALVAAAWQPAPAGRTALGWRGRAVTAILAVTALVKIVAALPLAMFVLFTLMIPSAAGRRIKTALDHLWVVAAAVVVFAAPYGWPGVRAMADLASRRGWASAAHLAERGAGAIGGPAGRVLEVVVALAFAAALAVILWALVRRPPAHHSELGARWGTGLLGAALAGPYVLPWYAAWFASTIGLVRDRAVLWIAVAATCVLGLTGVPAEPGAAPGLYRSSLLVVHYVAAPAIAILLAALVLRSIRRPGRETEETGPPATASPPRAADIVPAP
jgi:hypothetical protein